MRRPSTTRLVGGLGAGLLSIALTGCGAIAGVSAPPTGSAGGAVEASHAQAVAARVIATAEKAVATPTAAGDAFRAAAFTGDALTAAKADAKLAPTASQATKDAAKLTPSPPVVLAVSRGLTYPRSMVVQTTRAQSGLPVLSLLTTPDVRTPYRIAASAPMLPSAQVKLFDPFPAGSPGLGDESGLSVKPAELAKEYAAYLAFPAPAVKDVPFVSDSFATGVRAHASATNQQLNGGDLTQQHAPKDVVGGLRLRGGRGALVFTVLDRKDTLLRRTQGTLTPTPQFTALTGKNTLSTEANLQTLEFVVFFVPETGKAVTVAAEEHLYAATGT